MIGDWGSGETLSRIHRGVLNHIHCRGLPNAQNHKKWYVFCHFDAYCGIHPDPPHIVTLTRLECCFKCTLLPIDTIDTVKFQFS